MITKDQINAANKRVKDVDAKLGKLTGQILEARGKALECKRKAEAKKAELPIDASMAQHQAAAREAAADLAKHEGERKYWAELHERLTQELAATRMEAAQAEAACVQLAKQFWEGRSEEQTRALFERNFDAFKDLLGTFVQLNGYTPRPAVFWQWIFGNAPYDMEQMKPGVMASERVLPAPAIAENLRSEDREAATGIAHGADDGRRARMLAAVGLDCSQEAEQNVRGRENSTRRAISHQSSRIYNERRNIANFQEQLNREKHRKDKEKTKELSAKIADAESTIANAEAAIKTHEATLAECAAQLAAIETERAKLEAVKVG